MNSSDGSPSKGKSPSKGEESFDGSPPVSLTREPDIRRRDCDRLRWGSSAPPSTLLTRGIYKRGRTRGQL